jgi:hypothetical protein
MVPLSEQSIGECRASVLAAHMDLSQIHDRRES